MEKERIMLKLTDVLRDLQKGSTYVVPLHNPADLELIKTAAFFVMGPLWVTVDIQRERYLVKRDVRREYEENPSRWF